MRVTSKNFKFFTHVGVNILGNSTLPVVTVDPILLLEINPGEHSAAR